MSRSRTTISPSIAGTYGYPNFGPPREHLWTIQARETIVDNPPGQWNDFYVDKAYSSNPCISGVSLGGWNEIYTNWCPLGFRDPGENNPIPSIPGSPTNGEAATKLLAITNPSRPVVSIPNFVYELREFPKLLKIEGDNLLQKAGSANLNYHFGWAPLIGDLTKLLSFSDHVSKREKELKALFTSGLRRKRQLFNESGSESGYNGLNSWLIRMGAFYTATSTEKVWGYVEWFPTGPTRPQTASEMRALARQAVLGLTLDLSTAWEAIPWSWLVDWCSNVGDYLTATRNTVGASHGPVYIMRTRKGESIWEVPKGGDVDLFPGGYPTVKRTRIQKSRTRSEPSISAQLPYLSLRQLSILGSIGVTRRVGKRST